MTGPGGDGGPVVVTGGTGTLGRLVVRRLVDRGHHVRVVSRGPAPIRPGAADWATADLRTGRGVDAAVAKASVIVHCASGRGDVAAARHLLRAARPGSPHVVYISIVGVDRVPLRYYRSKLEVEAMIERSPLPWTTLRSTQFHELIVRACRALARPPVMVVPARTDVQPVAADEVAQRMVALAEGDPAGRVDDMGGPQVRHFRDLALSYLAVCDAKRTVVPFVVPGAAGAGFRRGGHLAPGHAVGTTTFEQFLVDLLCPGDVG